MGNAGRALFGASAEALLDRGPSRQVDDRFSLAPDGCRPTEIAARAQMTKQATNRLLRDLERGGYIRLERHPVDQRARIVRLTRRGWDLIVAIREVVEQVEAEWRTRLGARRFARC